MTGDSVATTLDGFKLTDMKVIMHDQGSFEQPEQVELPIRAARVLQHPHRPPPLPSAHLTSEKVLQSGDKTHKKCDSKRTRS